MKNDNSNETRADMSYLEGKVTFAEILPHSLLVYLLLNIEKIDWSIYIFRLLESAGETILLYRPVMAC